MNTPVYPKLTLLHNSLFFFKKHFWIIMALGLIAAFGRVIQLGGFGVIASGTHLILEIAIESARIILFLYVLGLANVKSGLLRIKRFFTQKGNRKTQWRIALQNMKQQWMVLLLNIVGFAILAWLINYLINLLAYETCLLLTLKQDGILAPSSSEWTILLFFKNLSIIPFTLIFETLLVLWITDKIRNYRTLSAN